MKYSHATVILALGALLSFSAMAGGNQVQDDAPRRVKEHCGNKIARSYEGLDMSDRLNGQERLQRCLMELRDGEFPQKSECGMWELAADEWCAPYWGFLGQDRRNCKYSKRGHGYLWNMNKSYCI